MSDINMSLFNLSFIDMSAQTLIIGIGNPYRGDDAFGCMIVRDLLQQLPKSMSCIEHDGEPAGLIESWQGQKNVILIDAVSSGNTPGHVFQFDLSQEALPEDFNLYSTHAFGVPQAVELARALHKLPETLWFIGVEGENFAAGEVLSPVVARRKETLVHQILNLL